MKFKLSILSISAAAILFTACGGDPGTEAVDPPTIDDPVEETQPANDGPNKGVGPITSVDVPEAINTELAATGEELFTVKCTACHKIDERYVGPPLRGITDKRTPEWIMNMIMVPEQMVAEDPDAKALLAEYLAPMANQSITEDEARALLEYFRTQK